MGKEVVNATSETNSRGPSFDNLQDATIAYDPQWKIQSVIVQKKKAEDQFIGDTKIIFENKKEKTCFVASYGNCASSAC